MQLATPKMKIGSKKESDKSEEKKQAPKKKTSPAPKETTSTSKKRQLLDDDEFEDTEDEEVEADDEDDDEVIKASIQSKKKNNNVNIKFLAIAIVAVVVVIFIFLIFVPKKNNDNALPMDDYVETVPPVATVAPTPIPTEVPDDLNLGTQDFRTDTTMTSSSPMTNPDDYTKDLYGLSLQVNFEVAKISDATDFVNYTKHRGTWGGGLELYYLDAEYKGNKYVIQVPFKYYKELDDTGIVPVKMEVLRVQSETDGSYLTIISYMSLDENTLQAVLNTQKK